MSTALICSLGTSAPVVSETLNALFSEKHIHIDRLIIIHTSSNMVLIKKTRPSNKDIGLIALQAFLKWNNGKNNALSDIEFIPEKLEFEDIVTEDQNKDLLRKMIEVVDREKMLNDKVYISIAGGRKTMSALLMVAAYLNGCDGIFHVVVDGDEDKLTDELGFEIPVNLLSLIETPLINLKPILQTVLSEIDRDNKYGGNIYNYIAAGQDMNTVFDKCNKELQSSLMVQKLKEEYLQRHDRYEQMCSVVNAILREYSIQAKIMKPQQESRVKTFVNILEKIDRKRANGKIIDDPFQDINDIAGCRIICYFTEDIEKIKNKILIADDFDIRETVYIESTSIRKIKIELDKNGSRKEIPETQMRAVGYNATHYIVTLKPPRTALLEYSNLKDIKCEIQIKTIFDHAWAQVDHRLRYKNEEFLHHMPENIKLIVDDVFNKANVNLTDAKEKFSKLRSHYKLL